MHINLLNNKNNKRLKTDLVPSLLIRTLKLKTKEHIQVMNFYSGEGEC